MSQTIGQTKFRIVSKPQMFLYTSRIFPSGKVIWGGSSNIQKFILLHQPEISQVFSAMPLLLCDINATVRNCLGRLAMGGCIPFPIPFRAHLHGSKGARQLAGIVQGPTTTSLTN